MANITTAIAVTPQAMQSAGTGWTQYAAPNVRRMLISTQARQGAGKTHFALTAPGPTAFLNADDGLEAVIEKFIAQGKQIAVKDFRVNPLKQLTDGEWDKTWYAMRDSYLWAVACGHFRTVVVDTGSAMWDYCRMEAFGKLTQVPPLRYQEVNGQFEAMIRHAYAYPVNVVLCHRMKQEYANDAAGRGQKTGGWTATGYKDIGYAVQVEIEQAWHPVLNAPALRVVGKCRPRQDAVGYELYGVDCNFGGLGKLCYPGTTDADWSDGTKLPA